MFLGDVKKCVVMNEFKLCVFGSPHGTNKILLVNTCAQQTEGSDTLKRKIVADGQQYTVEVLDNSGLEQSVC